MYFIKYHYRKVEKFKAFETLESFYCWYFQAKDKKNSKIYCSQFTQETKFKILLLCFLKLFHIFTTF